MRAPKLVPLALLAVHGAAPLVADAYTIIRPAKASSAFIAKIHDQTVQALTSPEHTWVSRSR